MATLFRAWIQDHGPITRGFDPDTFGHLGLKPRKYEIDGDPRAEARGHSIRLLYSSDLQKVEKMEEPLQGS